jgi:alcohol dehydrogenase
VSNATAAIFHAVGQPLELRTIPIPRLEAGQILVRITATTLCGSDLHTFDGRRSAPMPTILGHEIIGRIAAFGADATRADATGQPLGENDRITWSLVASCGDCFFCRRKLPQKCERAVKYGHELLRPGRELTGGLADHCILVPGTTILKIPDALSDAIACPANCATATVAAALGAVGELRDRAILITGTGMLGLTACAMARSMGAAAVICTDVNAPRRQRAPNFGATHIPSTDELASIVKEITSGYGVDAVLELSGSPHAFEAALPLLRIGGTLVLVGAVFPTPPVPLAMEQLVRRNLRLIGVHNYGPDDLKTAVHFLEANRACPFESLVERWFALSSAQAAFTTALAGDVIRVGVKPDQIRSVANAAGLAGVVRWFGGGDGGGE